METTIKLVRLWASTWSRTSPPSSQCLIKTATFVKYSEPLNDWISTFESRPDSSEQRLKVKRVWSSSFSDKYFDIINLLARSYRASHIPVDDSLDDDFNVNEEIKKISKPQALNDLAFYYLDWNCLRSKNMINSVNPSSSRKAVILTQGSM